MDIYSTRPIEEIKYIRFKEIILNKSIEVSDHAFDHLSEKQRKIYKSEDLIQIVEKEKPRKIYLQRNGRYAAFYRKSDGFRKLILEVEDNNVTIVTFMNYLEIPKYRI